jgi:purine-nucleoside/S-methyl-5'-thioadenosine phosphorylase / adenosine deaminase
VELRNGIFHSNLFEDTPILHGFTTRAWGNLGFGKKPGDPEVIANRLNLFESEQLDTRALIQPKQVHTNVCVSGTDFVPGMQADATYSKSSDHLLSVLTADCLPILVSHPEGIVAAIHAGWRGIYEEIIPKTLALLPPNTKVAVGPSIGPCCYEVGADLAEQFARKFGRSVVVAGKDKPHFDLRLAAMLQLQNSGVDEMDVCEICTSCHPDLFFSYRRDGSSGRMMSYIGLV